MAKRKNDQFKIIAVIGLGLVVFLMMNRARPPYLPQQSYVPPRPVNQTPQAIAAWVTSMIQIFGNVRELWQPGGPFYKPSPEVQAALDALRLSPPTF